MKTSKPTPGGARMPEPLSVMGTTVHPFESVRHAVDCIAERIAAGTRTFCLAINPEKVCRALRDAEVARLLGQADVCICDGIGIVLAARVLHGRRIVRCTGIELFFDLIAEAPARSWKVFLFGSSPASNGLACARLLEAHPGLRIVGSRDGYFGEPAEVVGQINSSGADMLFVAMGSPRQERWICDRRDELTVPFRMGIGGTLDVISGRARWAPAVFRRTGTEFLYRLVRQPGRWRRQMTYPMFVSEVFGARMRGGTSGSRARAAA